MGPPLVVALKSGEIAHVTLMRSGGPEPSATAVGQMGRCPPCLVTAQPPPPQYTGVLTDTWKGGREPDAG